MKSQIVLVEVFSLTYCTYSTQTCELIHTEWGHSARLLCNGALLQRGIATFN